MTNVSYSIFECAGDVPPKFFTAHAYADSTHDWKRFEHVVAGVKKRSNPGVRVTHQKTKRFRVLPHALHTSQVTQERPSPFINLGEHVHYQ